VISPHISLLILQQHDSLHEAPHLSAQYLDRPVAKQINPYTWSIPRAYVIPTAEHLPSWHAACVAFRSRARWWQPGSRHSLTSAEHASDTSPAATRPIFEDGCLSTTKSCLTVAYLDVPQDLPQGSQSAVMYHPHKLSAMTKLTRVRCTVHGTCQLPRGMISHRACPQASTLARYPTT
jgi:hypothetical protein